MYRPFRTVIVLAFLATTTSAQSRKYQSQAITLKRVIEREHFSPRPVNDVFSEKLFTDFLLRLDPYRLYFTADDVKQLAVFRQQLDNELQGVQWSFLDKIFVLYKERLKKADTLITAALQKPLDLAVSEKMSLHADSLLYATSDKALQLKWQKWLKYRTLDFLAEICEMKKGAANTCLQYEAVARERRSAELRNIKRTLQHPSGYENYVASIYCETVASLFDPHTTYMPKTEMEAFETHMTTEGLYFGLTIIENAKGEIELAQLMPGSPAWKSGDLNQGDIIVQLGWQGKEPVSTDGASAEEVSAILDESNSETLNLTVRKTNGTIKTVSLVKEVVSNDDDIVKGFILKGERRIGYIYLPAFYSSFESYGGVSCANDVAKEIVKLKKENIQGLILDVRYNLGGSMAEALDMAGIFVEDGPLAMVKDKEGKSMTYKDPSRGTIYDGPLLILINGQSASASELVAGVLQDYNRAVIVGSNTFGKGTVQTVFPVDTSRSSKATVITDANPEHGFVKLTIQKFYRVSGTTTQHKGVQPDIVLPEFFDIDFSESIFPNALPADTTKKNQYYKPLSSLPISTLKQKSENRVAASALFQKVKQAETVFQAQQKAETGTVSLKWNDYFTHYMAGITSIRNLDLPASAVAGKYEVDNTQFDMARIKVNTFEQSLSNQWKHRLLYDIYVQEAFNIINDLIAIPK